MSSPTKFNKHVTCILPANEIVATRRGNVSYAEWCASECERLSVGRPGQYKVVRRRDGKVSVQRSK